MLYYEEALGLAEPPRLALNLDDFEEAFLCAQPPVAPGPIQSKASSAEQDKALEMTAVLNDAFRTLRDPVARSEYFLKERGLELAEDRAA